jgi:hypothetical protein
MIICTPSDNICLDVSMLVANNMDQREGVYLMVQLTEI